MAVEDKKQRIKGFLQRGKGEAPAVSLFSRRELYIPLIAALVTTYIHFWGYAYLKGKLEKVGFDGLEIELTLLESIYQSALSLANIFISITKTDLGLLVATIAGFAAYIYLLSFLNHLMDAFRKPNKKETKVANQPESKSALKESFFKTNKSFRAIFVIVGLIASLIYLLLIMLYIPNALGNHHAGKYVEAKRCSHFFWDEVKVDRVKGCTRLTIKSQNAVSGEIIFKNKELMVFTTGDISYLLDSSNNIIATTHFHSNPNIQEESPEQGPKP